jgi:hypothetical protein
LAHIFRQRVGAARVAVDHKADAPDRVDHVHEAFKRIVIEERATAADNHLHVLRSTVRTPRRRSPATVRVRIDFSSPTRSRRASFANTRSIISCSCEERNFSKIVSDAQIAAVMRETATPQFSAHHLLAHQNKLRASARRTATDE